MRRWLITLLIIYVVTYVALVIAWTFLANSDGAGCTAGQEIEEGCKIIFPATYFFLAFINIPLAATAAIALTAFNLFRKSPKPNS